MDSQTEIELLKVEYQRCASEQHVYIQQYAPTLSVFGTVIVTGLGFALANKGYEILYAIIPFVILIIGSVGVAQAHIIASLGIRIRDIESQISRLNGNRDILQWEKNYASQLIFPPFISIPTYSNKKVNFINPVFLTTLIIVLSAFLLSSYSAIKGFDHLSKSIGYFWSMVYMASISMFLAVLIVSAFGFFRLGSVTESLMIDCSKKSSL